MKSNVEKIYYYCSNCKWYIPESKVLSAVHYRAMCPRCYAFKGLPLVRKINNRMVKMI